MWVRVNYGAAKMGVVGLSRSIALDMGRFGVRSNIISPSAFTRMIETIPIKGPEGEVRRKRQKAMTPAKIAAPVAYLLSDAAKDVTGQIFYVRSNEIMLMSQNRPVRIIHRGEGWTPQLIHEHAMPALRPHFTPSAPSGQYFTLGPGVSGRLSIPGSGNAASGAFLALGLAPAAVLIRCQ